MINTVKSHITRFLFEKRRRRRLISLLTILAVAVCLGVFWNLHTIGVAMTNPVYCGLEEHTHSPEAGCYEQVPVCGLEAGETVSVYETEEVQICGDDSDTHTHTEACYEAREVPVSGSEVPHIHTEACYTEKLTCTIPEHTHSVECLSDETADVETAADWEATLPDDTVLTGIRAEDIVAIARSQIGYTESTRNFILDEDGKTRKGYTRYGAWYGNPYGDWSAMFASFCLSYAGVPETEFPEASGVHAWTVALTDTGRYESAEDAAPEPGNLIFFDTDGDGLEDRVGIIASLETETDPETGDMVIMEIRTIEGDADDAVQEKTYDPRDAAIVGYGILPEQPEAEIPESETADIEHAAEAEESPEVTDTPESEDPAGDTEVSDGEDPDSPEEAADAEGEEDPADAEEPADTEDTPDKTGPSEAEDSLRTWTAPDGGIPVTVTASEGSIPDGAELHVTVYDEDSDAYAEAAEVTGTEDDAVSEGDLDTSETGMIVLDISFMLDGETVEPSGPVTVRMDISAVIPEDAAEGSIVIRHLEETDAGIDPVVVAVLDADVPAVEFEVESFSNFTIHWHATKENNDEFNVHQIDGTCYFETDIGSNAYEPNDALNPIPGGQLDLAYGNKLIFDDTDGLLTVAGYKLDYALLKLGEDTDDDSSWQEDADEFLVYSLTSVYNWQNGSWTVSFEYYPTEADFGNPDALETYTLPAADRTAIHVHLYYDRVYTGGTGDLTIIDDIQNSGSLIAKYTGAAAAEANFAGDYYYKWYMLSGTDADGTEIWAERIGEITNTLAVYSFGARKAFRVELYRVADNALIDAYSSYTVPYYDQIQNGSFEDTPSGQITDGLYPEMVWRTTGYGTGGAAGQDIEIINISKNTSAYGESAARDGVQYAELNAEAAGTLYQDIMTSPGTSLYWALSHEARVNSSKTDPDTLDTMCVVIADAEFAAKYITSQTQIDAIVRASGLQGGSSGDHPSATFTYTQSGETVEITVWRITSDATGWHDYIGEYMVPDHQYVTRFLFGAVSTSNGNKTTGNLLDNVYLSTNPRVTDKTGAITITKTVSGVSASEVIPAGTYTFEIYYGDNPDPVRTIALPTSDAKITDTACWSTSYADIVETSGQYHIVEKISDERTVEISGYTKAGTSYEISHSGDTTETNTSGSTTETTGFMVYTNQITGIEYTNSYEPDDIRLEKVDASDSGRILTGAVFEITDSDGNAVRFTADTDTEGNTVYRAAEESDEGAKPEAGETVSQITLGSATLAGLGSGQYTLTEVIPPEGYNILYEPVVFTISGGVITADSDAAASAYNDTLKLQIKNKAGAELPNTGGIGTVIFHVIGCLIILTAAAVLILRKKRDRHRA